MLSVVKEVQFGCDPELFFEKDGKVIGAEKVIPPTGLKVGSYKVPVVLDGVQVELNPTANKIVKELAINIGEAFNAIKTQLKLVPGVSVCYRRFVDVGREELDSLDEKSRILGCKPSKNIYGERPMTADLEGYTKRSTGGHMHFGLRYTALSGRGVELVPPLDIFIGNLSVLLDRDPHAAERRENYGRSGEYREPAYGIEYRTLSSFWLRNYALMDLVFGMAKFAMAVVAAGDKVERELIELVNIERFVRAIDLNDFDMALDNLNTIRPFIAKFSNEQFPLHAANFDRFLVLAKGVKEKGLETFFPQDPMEHWIGVTDRTKEPQTFAQFLETIY